MLPFLSKTEKFAAVPRLVYEVADTALLIPELAPSAASKVPSAPRVEELNQHTLCSLTNCMRETPCQLFGIGVTRRILFKVYKVWTEWKNVCGCHFWLAECITISCRPCRPYQTLSQFSQYLWKNPSLLRFKVSSL